MVCCVDNERAGCVDNERAGCVDNDKVDCVDNDMAGCDDNDIAGCADTDRTDCETGMDACAETEVEVPGKSGGSPIAISFDPQLPITQAHIHHWRQMSTIPF